MAHGFLTPTPVSGDRYWQNAKSIFDLLSKLLTKGKKADPKGGPLMAFQQNGQNVQAVKVNVETPQKSAPPAVAKMLGATAKQMLGAGNTSSGVTTAGNNTTPSSGPQLPGTKGGSFVDVATPSTGLNTDTFFKSAVISGVNPSTGEYLSKEDRIAAFKAGKSKVQPASSGPEISPDSGVEIVAAVNRMTMAVMNLVDATKSQTETQKQLSQAQLAQADQLSQRARAEGKEKALEGGSDLSGFLTASGGLGGMRPSSSGTGGGSGGSGGGPGLGIGGKVVAQAVGKRGAGRLGSRLAAKFGGKAAAKAAQRYGGKIASKLGVKAAGGAIAKSLAKKVPVLGLGVGALFAAKRALEGDLVGAGLELASGAASTVPGIGTAGSIGLDATLAARDAGMVPFAKGGIVDRPVNALIGEAGREGVFPLEGKQGKDTFLKFGEGILDAQEKRRRDYARIQSLGLKQYYENEGGNKNLAKTLVDIFKGIGGALGRLFGGGPANAATTDPADYLDTGIGGSTAERNAAAFLSTLEGGSGQNAADTFQVMLNRTANAKAGGAMKAYGNTLFDQITAQSQFSPFSAAIHDRATGDPAADKKYGAIRAKLGKNAAERKAKLLEIAGQPDGIAQLQKLFNAGSATEASKILKDFETGGTLSKEAAKGVRGAVSFRGQALIGNKKAGDFYRGTGGNFFFNGLGGQAASLSAVSAEPPDGGVLNTGRLPPLPRTGTLHGQAYGANRKGGRKHAGVDFDISGNEKFFSRIGGEVIFAGWGGAGYGNTVDIYNKDLNVTERIAEGAKLLVSQGATVKPGTAVTQGESKTGVIHYEIRKGRATASGSFEGTLNPLNFLSSLSSKNKDTAGGGGGGGGGTPAAKVNRGGQRGGGSSPGSIKASAANPNTGTPIATASQQVAMSSIFAQGKGGGGTVVNNFYNAGSGGDQTMPNGVPPGMTYTGTGLGAFTLAQLNR